MTITRCLISLLLAWATAAPAATTWDNSNATQVWSTAANWDTNIEPLAADDLIFPLGLGATVTLSTGELATALSFLDNYTFTGGGLITGALAFHIAQSPVTFPRRFFRAR